MNVWTIPNLISFVRLLLVPVFLWLLFPQDNPAAAGWLLGALGATDWVDGYLARRLDQVSVVGEFLDPLADRLAVAAAVIGGLVAGVLPAVIAVPLIVREAAVAVGALIIGARAGAKLQVRALGKLATMMLYFAIAGFFVGEGTPFDPLVWAGWIFGVPGVILYYVVAAQYLGDARRLLAAE